LLNSKKLPIDEIKIDGDKANNPILNFGLCEEEIINRNEHIPEDDYRSDIDPATCKKMVRPDRSVKFE
jgi:hypothetical protein